MRFLAYLDINGLFILIFENDMTERIHPPHKTLRDNDRRFRFLYHTKTMNRLSCTEIDSIENFGLFNSFQICIKNLSETNRLRFGLVYSL